MPVTKTSAKRLLAIVLVCIFTAGCDNTPQQSETAYTKASIEQNAVISAATPSAPETLQIPVTQTLLKFNFANMQTIEMYNAKAKVYNTEGEIITGVAPHHLAAGELMAGFFKTAALSRADIETIVIIAPSHYPTGAALCTTLDNWAAPFGVMYNDRVISQAFVNNLDAELNNDIVSTDHSAAELLPFAQYYFPEALVSVLLVSSLADIAAVDELTALLKHFSEQKECLFVFSADFSHFLSLPETEARDGETLNAVLSGDTRAIAEMTDANVDFPLGINAFIKLNEHLSLEISMLEHTNSLFISGLTPNHPAFDNGLTSYFLFCGKR